MTTQPDNGSPEDLCANCGHARKEHGKLALCKDFRPLSKPEPEGGKAVIGTHHADGGKLVPNILPQESDPPGAAKELPCPFCNDSKDIETLQCSDGYLVRCHNCETGWIPDQMWNAQPRISSLTRELEEAKAEARKAYDQVEELSKDAASEQSRWRDERSAHEQTKAELAEAKSEQETVRQKRNNLLSSLTVDEQRLAIVLDELRVENSDLTSALAATRKELEELRVKDVQLCNQNGNLLLDVSALRAELGAVRKASESESSEHKRSKAWITELEKYRDKLIAERDAALAAKEEAEAKATRRPLDEREHMDRVYSVLEKTTTELDAALASKDMTDRDIHRRIFGVAVTAGLPSGTDDWAVALEYLSRKSKEAHISETVLRGLASFLSVGGYSSVDFNPEAFDSKIREGIKLLTEPLISQIDTYKRQAEEAEGKLTAITTSMEEGSLPYWQGKLTDALILAAETESKLKSLTEDWAESDTAIREIAERHGVDTKGDTFYVPPAVECVEKLARSAADSAALAEKRGEVLRLVLDLIPRFTHAFSRPSEPHKGYTVWLHDYIEETLNESALRVVADRQLEKGGSR